MRQLKRPMKAVIAEFFGEGENACVLGRLTLLSGEEALSSMEEAREAFLGRLYNAKKLHIIAAPFLDAVVASAVLFHSAVASGLDVDLDIAYDLDQSGAVQGTEGSTSVPKAGDEARAETGVEPDVDGEATSGVGNYGDDDDGGDGTGFGYAPEGKKDNNLILVVGAFHLSGIGGEGVLYFDYAPWAGEKAVPHLVARGALASTALDLTLFGNALSVSVGEADPILRSPSVEIPSLATAYDLYASLLPPVPPLTGNPSLLGASAKVASPQQLFQEYASSRGFGYKLEEVERPVFSAASEIEGKIASRSPEAAAEALRLADGEELKYEPSEELLSSISKFFSVSDEWLTVPSETGSVMLLTGDSFKLSLSAVLPSLVGMPGVSLPLYVIEPRSEESATLWGFGSPDGAKRALQIGEGFGGKSLVSSRFAMVQVPVSAIDLANSFEKSRWSSK